MGKTATSMLATVALIMGAVVLADTQASATGAGDQSSREAACGPEDRGRLLRRERVASYETADAVRLYFEEWIAFYQDYYAFPNDLPVRFKYGFDSYKVTYCTVDAPLEGRTQGRPTTATGMLSVPRRQGPLPTVIYLHGTSTSFYDAPSNPNIYGEFNEDGESFDGPPSNSIFAGAGFIYIAPDYLGLGDSSVPRHRYFHAASEASAAVDMLAAARQALSTLHVAQDDRLFTFGFSQGGHAALALHRALQSAHIDVAATATVGGVLDVEQWFLSSLANETTATLPLYMSYLLLAYDDVYGLYDRTSQVFAQPYASTVKTLFDMQHYFDDVLAGLPATSRELLRPAWYDVVTTDPRHPLRMRLRQNAVDRWRPHAAVRIYHSVDDEEVPYLDALTSAARLHSHGADVQVRTLAGFDHVNSWIQAMPRAARWFASFE